MFNAFGDGFVRNIVPSIIYVICSLDTPSRLFDAKKKQIGRMKTKNELDISDLAVTDA